MDKCFNHYVENMCISPCKTLFILLAKLCALFHHAFISCAKLRFSTHFSNVSHLLFHKSPTPVFQQSFPLFHTPYYYYYKFLNNINNNYRKDIL